MDWIFTIIHKTKQVSLKGEEIKCSQADLSEDFEPV